MIRIIFRQHLRHIQPRSAQRRIRALVDKAAGCVGRPVCPIRAKRADSRILRSPQPRCGRKRQLLIPSAESLPGQMHDRFSSGKEGQRPLRLLMAAGNAGEKTPNPGKGRHASYSTIDLSFLGLDKDKDVESLGQKILTLAAPYVPLDGVNDAGVACGIFMSYQGEGKGTPTDTQTDKPDLTSTTLLRLILDYADSVEDAVALAQQYDLHDSASSCFHYMVADSTGRSAILEWVGADADHDTDGSQRQLNVLWNDTDALSDSSDWQVVTNFIKTPGYYDGTTVEMKGLDRYEHLAAALRQTNGVVADKNAAMDLLASVGRRTWNNDDSNTNTVHSVVYDLTDQSVLWVGNEHYGEDGYTFEFQLGA